MLLTSAEMWSLQASPLFHDAYGKKDIEQPDNLRIYYLAGGQHSISSNAINWRPESTLYPGSTAVDGAGIKRALWIAFEEWVVNGIEPPANMIPKIKDGSLVFPEDLKFPEMKGLSWNTGNGKMKIPDFTYFGIINSMTLLDFGPDFIEYDESGIATILPPNMPGNEYAIMVSQVDEDGNEIAGIRSIDLIVPTGTSFGFNYTTKPELGDLAGLSGAFIPFHKTKKERLAAGDTRLSLEERYGNKTEYIKRVTEAVQMMISRRLVLQEDGD